MTQKLFQGVKRACPLPCVVQFAPAQPNLMQIQVALIPALAVSAMSHASWRPCKRWLVLSWHVQHDHAVFVRILALAVRVHSVWSSICTYAGMCCASVLSMVM